MRKPRKRHVIAAGISVAGVMAIAVPLVMVLTKEGQAPTEDKAACEIKQLPGKGKSKNGEVQAVSADGEYMAGLSGLHYAMWHNGEYVDMHHDTEEYSDTSGSLLDVNSKGVAVGSGAYAQDVTGPWKWADGKFTQLRAPEGLKPDAASGDEVEITGINDAGEISGYFSGNGGKGEEVPLKWESGADEATPLELQEEKGKTAGITESGKIVGSQSGGDASKKPWVWEGDGAGEQLPSLPHGISAGPIRVGGEFALSNYGGSKHQHYVWDLSKMDVVADPVEMKIPEGVDGKGRAVGEDFVESEESYAVVEAEGKPEKLPQGKGEGVTEGPRNVVNGSNPDRTVLVGTAGGAPAVWTGC